MTDRLTIVASFPAGTDVEQIRRAIKAVAFNGGLSLTQHDPLSFHAERLLDRVIPFPTMPRVRRIPTDQPPSAA